MFTQITRNTVSQLIIAASIFALANASSANSFEAYCASATTIDSNGSAWNAGYDDTQTYNIETETTGILVIDVTTSDPSAEPPRLILLGRGCVEPGTTGDFTAVEQSASYQVIAVQKPGTYSFRMASSGADSALPEYEVRSDFTPARIVERETILPLNGSLRMVSRQKHFLVDQFVLKSEEEVVDPNPDNKSLLIEDSSKSEEEVVDPNADGNSDLNPVLSLLSFYTVPLQKSEEEVVDPNPDLKSEEEVVDPNPDLKSEEEVVDPNPDFATEPNAALVATLVLFPDEANGGKSHDETSIHGDSRDLLLRWLAEML